MLKEGGAKAEKKKGQDSLCIHWNKRLLGSLRISVGAVYHAMEISGTFELEVSLLFSYCPIFQDQESLSAHLAP